MKHERVLTKLSSRRVMFDTGSSVSAVRGRMGGAADGLSVCTN